MWGNQIVWRWMLLCGAVAVMPGAAETGVAQESKAVGWPSGPLVRTRLLLDPSYLEQSRTSIAVEFSVAPGWYVFWKNSGQVGKATRVEFFAPEDCHLSEAQYPGPTAERFSDHRIAYTYQGQVMVSAVLDSDCLDVLSGDPAISARASWAVCDQERCQHGAADLTLRVPFTWNEHLEYESLFQRHNASLPQLPSADPRLQVLMWDPDALWFRRPGVERMEFFPSFAAEAGQDLYQSVDNEVLELPVSGKGVHGLLALHHAEGVRFIKVNVER